MKTIMHPAKDRGHANHGWLDTYHSFSFASYYNPAKLHFGQLRVINDDTVDGGMGFGAHPHDNMEIITIPLSGVLEHADNTGHREKLKPGEVQIMSAGTGIVHSEYNASETEPVSLFQIWIFPKERNIKPRYAQKDFSGFIKKNEFLTVVAPETDGESLWINQDAWLSLVEFDSEDAKEYSIRKDGNGVFVMVIEGSAEIAEEQLGKRDAIGIYDTDQIIIKPAKGSRLLLIDVPMH